MLVFEGWPTLLAGGQERSLFEVIGGLRARGVGVTLAYEEDGELVPEYQASGVKTFKIITRNLLLKSFKSPWSIRDFVVSLWRILNQSRAAKGKWNLIYINQYFDVTLAALCGLILRIPVVCHLRLAAPPYLSRQFRWGLGRCQLLICNSEYTAQTYIDAGIPPEKIAVVLNAIDTEKFSPADHAEAAFLAQRNTRQVLYVGRIAPEKGIEILIDAVAAARTMDPRITLLVVGNPRGGDGATAEYLESLRKLASEKLGAAVEFRPATPNVVDLYRDADVTVLPAVWDEPFGRVVIESMACGIPCLASRVGGIPEILKDGHEGMLFKSGASDQLSARIQSLINWRIDNPEIAVQCRERVLNNFSSERMHEQVFEALLKQRSFSRQ
jgi:glycosyltransferase involved in cell wall biosynthesis